MKKNVYSVVLSLVVVFISMQCAPVFGGRMDTNKQISFLLKPEQIKGMTEFLNWCKKENLYACILKSRVVHPTVKEGMFLRTWSEAVNDAEMYDAKKELKQLEIAQGKLYRLKIKLFEQDRTETEDEIKAEIKKADSDLRNKINAAIAAERKRLSKQEK
ncbi:MAG: hypothetical protein HQM10_00060 [Candidatus Riflebacteria bacterium]|nr:hypothetical protein [Candidatus Riflebacteria bacterium]